MDCIYNLPWWWNLFKSCIAPIDFPVQFALLPCVIHPYTFSADLLHSCFAHWTYQVESDLQGLINIFRPTYDHLWTRDPYPDLKLSAAKEILAARILHFKLFWHGAYELLSRMQVWLLYLYLLQIALRRRVRTECIVIWAWYGATALYHC